MYRAPFQIIEPRDPPVVVELAPVHNILLTIMLLGDATRASSGWLAQTAKNLTAAELHRHRLVFEGLGEAIAPTDEARDFDAYLAALAATDPRIVRDRVTERFATIPGSMVRPAALLADRNAFAAQVARAYGADRFDTALFDEVHTLLNDPHAMHDVIVAHLRAMWEHVAPEWRRQQSSLAREVRTLSARIGAAPALDALRRALDEDVPEAIRVQLDGVERLVIAPSPHAGPLTMRFGSPTTLWLFVQSNTAKRTTTRPPAKRSELVGPLAALADDTRLQILEVLAQRGPMLAQELLAHFELSQPSLSRHLKQLTGSGYVLERRGTGANKRYEYNPATVEWTFRSLTQALTEPPVTVNPMPDVRDDFPDLRRYLDATGRIVMWPPKRYDQEKVYHYVAAKFEDGRDYTEREVNDTLQQWCEANDFVTLRRELFNHFLLERTPNGSRYWKGTGVVTGNRQ